MPKQGPKEIDLNKDLKTTGIILIILGVLHFVLSGFLNFTWGFVLVPIGIIALFYHSRRMLVVLGILLIIAGLWNFYITVQNTMNGGSSSFWGVLAFFQIYWGIKEIIRFRKIKENPRYLGEEKRKKGFVWYSLRISFVALVVFWVTERIISQGSWTFAILEWITLLFVFVMSIAHLNIHTKKDFAVLSLGVSIILILITSYNLIYLYFFVPNMKLNDVYTDAQIRNIEDYCSSSCNEVSSATQYYYYHNFYSGDAECDCVNNNNETLKHSIVPVDVVQSNAIKFTSTTTVVSPPTITKEVNEELGSGYVVFREFTNPTQTNELKLTFSSSLPIDVYFVPAKEDYDKFMQREQYNTYQGCFFENKISGIIDCNVSSGGIIIYNPNYQNITYSIR